jgi:serine/threonine-protein kinase
MSDSWADLSQTRVGELHQTQIGKAIAAKVPFQERYKVLKVLGRGGFGITFLAQDLKLPGELSCVIKLLSPATSDPDLLPMMQERFEQEARILGQLGGHAQIPMLLDYFETAREFYLVQEHVKGVTLAKLVESAGIFSEAEVIKVLQAILSVLGYIHDHQVIHRDIKPENLIESSDDGRLVLIDFGSVKERMSEAIQTSADASPITLVIGTHGFMPPEQMQKRPVYASDIYALGMTCLYLLTGNYPWELTQDMTDTTRFWRTHVPVSQALAKILQRMTALSLRERYRSAAEALADVSAWDIPDSSTLMTTASTQSLLQAGNEPRSPQGSNYLPPAVRLAMNIREWKARLQQRSPKSGESPR